MSFWQDAERKRRLLGISRAEMCRRAGISESTVTYALKRRTRPTNTVRRQIELVLAMEEQVQKDEAAGSRQTAVEVKALPAPEKTQKVGGYPVETIRAMWAEGRSTKEIAAAIGRTEGALSMWMTKNRDVCPKRLPDGGNGKVHSAGAPREGQAA